MSALPQPEGTEAGWLAALSRLDEVLEAAVGLMRKAGGDEEWPDLFRGLQIRPADVARILRDPPGVPAFGRGDREGGAALADSVPRLAWLGRTFALTAFDLNIVLLAIAPEIDLRYERLYAYLQDDVTRKRPAVALALDLFVRERDCRLALRSRFAPDAPLVRHGLLHLIPDPGQAQPPLLAHYLKLDDQVVNFLVGEDTLDGRLAAFCRLLDGGEAVANARVPGLPEFAADAVAQGKPVRIYLQGTSAGGKLEAARAIAKALGSGLLTVNLVLAPDGVPLAQTLQLALLAAKILGSVPYLDGLDAILREAGSGAYAALAEALAEAGGVAILSGTLPWYSTPRGPAGVLSVRIGPLEPASALECWRGHAARLDVHVGESDLALLAGRFRLTADQIADAAECAWNAARWSAAAHPDSSQNSAVTLDHLAAAARAECGQGLSKLARRISPVYTWDDIVLPDDQIAQLREACDQAVHRETVFGTWGFGNKLSLGRGLNVLFSGPPGTGKTMAAEVIARELRLDLYKIDLSQVVSKYIGETEKNLDRVFTAAEDSNAILFFDEADALFGKRSEVKDSHDRYANIEIGYLLQKMEEYEGIAILATNVREHIDEAFVRRIQVIVEFPFPDEAERGRVWRIIFPKEAPLEADVDFETLARRVRLASGNIRSIARASAFYAAADGGPIQMAHLIKAARREYQKLGRTWADKEPNNGHRAN